MWQNSKILFNLIECTYLGFAHIILANTQDALIAILTRSAIVKSVSWGCWKTSWFGSWFNVNSWLVRWSIANNSWSSCWRSRGRGKSWTQGLPWTIPWSFKWYARDANVFSSSEELTTFTIRRFSLVPTFAFRAERAFVFDQRNGIFVITLNRELRRKLSMTSSCCNYLK